MHGSEYFRLFYGLIFFLIREKKNTDGEHYLCKIFEQVDITIFFLFCSVLCIFVKYETG